MNVSRTIVTTAAALAVLATLGCTATHRAPEVATAPLVEEAAPPATDAMPSHPALQNERMAEATMTHDAPVVATYEPVMPTPTADFTERAPREDRN